MTAGADGEGAKEPLTALPPSAWKTAVSDSPIWTLCACASLMYGSPHSFVCPTFDSDEPPPEFDPQPAAATTSAAATSDTRLLIGLAAAEPGETTVYDRCLEIG
jgi:hypothetical protein